MTTPELIKGVEADVGGITVRRLLPRPAPIAAAPIAFLVQTQRSTYCGWC